MMERQITKRKKINFFIVKHYMELAEKKPYNSSYIWVY